MRVKLPILYKSEESDIDEIIGREPPADESEIRTVIFYDISAVESYYENGREYAKVYSGGDVFISSLTVRQVDEIICGNVLQTQN